jgi:hypothetical protein
MHSMMKHAIFIWRGQIQGEMHIMHLARETHETFNDELQALLKYLKKIRAFSRAECLTMVCNARYEIT